MSTTFTTHQRNTSSWVASPNKNMTRSRNLVSNHSYVTPLDSHLQFLRIRNVPHQTKPPSKNEPKTPLTPDPSPTQPLPPIGAKNATCTPTSFNPVPQMLSTHRQPWFSGFTLIFGTGSLSHMNPHHIPMKSPFLLAKIPFFLILKHLKTSLVA